MHRNTLNQQGRVTKIHGKKKLRNKKTNIVRLSSGVKSVEERFRQNFLLWIKQNVQISCAI